MSESGAYGDGFVSDEVWRADCALRLGCDADAVMVAGGGGVAGEGEGDDDAEEAAVVYARARRASERDPKAFEMPLVGLWVAGISSVSDAYAAWKEGYRNATWLKNAGVQQVMALAGRIGATYENTPRSSNQPIQSNLI